MMCVLLLLLGMHLRLIFTQLQVFVVGFKSVILQLDGSVGQFCVTVLEF